MAMADPEKKSTIAENENIVLKESPSASPASNLDSDMIGRVIDGHYEILELVGTGGMGTVYRANHIELNKMVALKLLDVQGKSSEQLLQRFDREAKAASSLRHQGIASVTNYGLADGEKPYLVMDFVEGDTLQKFLKDKGRFTKAETLEIMCDVAQAIQHAHEKRILHRDIKPSNIILERQQTRLKPIVIDFGIARIVHDEGEQAQNITKTGEVFGSPLYMSPEQGMGYKVDQRSDIYSLGCVMYECLTGQVPFEGENAIQTIFKHINERPKSFKQVSRDLSNLDDFELIILKCLEKKAADRYQSMEQLLDDLRRIQQGKKPNAAGLFVPKSKQIWLAAVASVGVGVLVTLFAFQFRGLVLQPQWQRLETEAFQEWRMGPDHYAKADKLFKQAVSRLDKDGASKEQSIILLVQMGRFYHSSGKNKDAVDAFVKAIKIADTMPNQVNVQLEGRKELLASLIQTGDYDTAIKEGNTALAIFDRLGPSSSETESEIAYTLGTAYRMKNESEKAAESYLRAYRVAKKLHPDQDSRMQAIAAQSLAYVMNDLNRKDDVMRYGLEALKIHKLTQGISANETQVAATWLASYASEHALPDQANAIKQEFNLK